VALVAEVEVENRPLPTVETVVMVEHRVEEAEEEEAVIPETVGLEELVLAVK